MVLLYRRGSAHTNGLTWFLRHSCHGFLKPVSTTCLSCPNNINFSLSRGNNRNVQKKRERSPHPVRLKYWCVYEVNGSKSVQEVENGSYEESEQGEEEKTSLVKLGSEGLGCIINEVKCVLYLWHRVGFTEDNPIFTGKTGLLLCSLRRSPAARKRQVASTPGSYHTSGVDSRKKRAVKMKGATSARWHIQLIIDDFIHYALKGTCWHQQKWTPYLFISL